MRFVVALLISCAAFAEEYDFFQEPITLGAHRGGALLWPENTVYAFEQAAQRWPHILLEVDVRVSKDGQFILMHDANVDRTTNGAGRVAEMTFEELRALDAAHDFTIDGTTFPHRGKGFKIPTLREALEAAPRHRFLLELKGEPENAPLLLTALREAGALDRVAFASFQPAVIDALRKEQPEGIFCYDMNRGLRLLQALRGGSWEKYVPEAKILSVTTELHAQFGITADEIAKIQSKGIIYQLHTLNARQDIERALEAGIGSILTDDPALLDELLKLRAAPASAATAE